MTFPAPFGRATSKEEAYIAEMNVKTGAMLTLLNQIDRIWTLVAAGGASVVYADAHHLCRLLWPAGQLRRVFWCTYGNADLLLYLYRVGSHATSSHAP